MNGRQYRTTVLLTTHKSPQNLRLCLVLAEGLGWLYRHFFRLPGVDHVDLRRTLTPLTVANNERYRMLQNVLTKRTFLGATLGATFLKAFLNL